MEAKQTTANLALADVMSFPKDMKNDQNKTENNLNDLSDKVSEMYDEYENYDENQLLCGDDANDDQNNRVDNSVDVDDIVQIDDNKNDSHPPPPQLNIGRLLMDSQRLRIMKK